MKVWLDIHTTWMKQIVLFKTELKGLTVEILSLAKHILNVLRHDRVHLYQIFIQLADIPLCPGVHIQLLGSLDDSVCSTRVPANHNLWTVFSDSKTPLPVYWRIYWMVLEVPISVEESQLWVSQRVRKDNSSIVSCANCWKTAYRSRVGHKTCKPCMSSPNTFSNLLKIPHSGHCQFLMRREYHSQLVQNFVMEQTCKAKA